MDTSLTKDAKGFVDSVVGYLKGEKGGKTNLPRVESLLTKVTSQAKKESEASIETAVALTADEKKELSQMLEKMFGHALSIKEKTNPALIAGIRIQIADWIVDTSYQKQLQTMSTLLTR